MDENQNIDFDSFDSLMDDTEQLDTTSGEDTAGAENPPATETSGDGAQQPQDGNGEGGEETPAAAETAPEASQGGDSFTLKVNKEERTVSREEVVALAQKGADYDRVKEALDQSKTAYAALENESKDARDAYSQLCEIAEESEITVADLLDHFRVERLKNQGIPEGEAKERLARMKLEKENAALRGAQPQQKTEAEQMKERADREIAEFQKLYPGVALTQELVNDLMADVHGGMTLVHAYQKNQNAKLEAENRRLAAELAAEKKNAQNRTATPGSMGDSGARKSKDLFDEFFDALD
jgi:hypothetical protein